MSTSAIGDEVRRENTIDVLCNHVGDTLPAVVGMWHFMFRS